MSSSEAHRENLKVPRKSFTMPSPWRRTSIAVDVSVTVLTVLKEAAQGAPYVGLVSALALEILTSAQGAVDNKYAFKGLVVDICSLVYQIDAVCKDLNPENDPEKLSPLLRTHLEGLEKTLTEIKDFAKKRGDRRFWRHYISSKSDLDRIQEFKQRVKQALDVFALQSHIIVRESVARIATRQEFMHEELRGQRRDSAPPIVTQSPHQCRLTPEALTHSPTVLQDNNPFRSAPSTPSHSQPADNPFASLLSSANITGNITYNHVAGNSSVSTNNNHSSISNTGNVYSTNTVNSNNVWHQRW
ncbi:hypothetical protein V5O48_014592 [Marasmius crinis-equi]|uniref:NACHT-NTPase and P-loop NTPases N-terminal domain-containing protein n=1 Tax=Marasmius crinis-equi TaxID=585013 RepID=A0ABR3EWV6_9AGAR